MDDDILFLLLVYPADVIQDAEVLFGKIGDEDVFTMPILVQPPYKMGAEKTFSARDFDSLFLEINHGR
jgi:hypothetical protein